MKDSLAVQRMDLIADAIAQLPKPIKGQIQTGTVRCPACGGRMAYRVVAARDSRAQCETAKCGLHVRS